MTTLTQRTTVIAGLGIGVLALHVADDSFLQPQPGTSATDHLAGGLVPLVLIAGAAFAYPRVRAGIRGVLALFFGLLALIMGVAEAGYYTLKVGPSGDDYTGLLAIAAGLVLVGLGAWTLWESRRLDDGRIWRYVRRALIAAARSTRRGRGHVPGRARLRDDAYPAPGRAGGEPRRRARGRHVQDERRARPLRLVRPVAKRRRGDRIPGSQRSTEAGAVSRASRIRRAALRPPRGGRERRRRQPLRLGRRQGYPRSRRVPEAPARRRSARGSRGWGSR